jgi:hypothetical protein
VLVDPLWRSPEALSPQAKPPKRRFEPMSRKSPLNNAPPPTLGMKLVTITKARERIPVSKAQIYKLLGKGKLRARKVAGRTLIEVSSIDELIAEAPPMVFSVPPSVRRAEEARATRKRLAAQNEQATLNP